MTNGDKPTRIKTRKRNSSKEIDKVKPCTGDTVSTAPNYSFVVHSTSNISSILEQIYGQLLQETSARGYSDPVELSLTILKNGLSIAVQSIEADSSMHPPVQPRRIGFVSDTQSQLVSTSHTG